MVEVSVVIPAYNAEKTILDALNSVKAQTAISSIKEIIVVNDGSTDKTKEIIEQYKIQNPQLPITLFDQENAGVSKTRNRGMSYATGKWIALLDSDDVWLPNKLARQMEEIEKNDEIDFLGCGYNNKPLRLLFKKIDHVYKAKYSDLCIKWFPVTPSAIFKKEIFETIGGFNETMKYAEDGEFFMRICMNYNYYYLPESLVDIGHGKREFGESGLSGNLKEMYKGNVHIMRNLYKEGHLTWLYYAFIRVFHYLKYLRRIIICKIR